MEHSTNDLHRSAELHDTTEDEYFVVQIVQIGSDGADIAWTAPIWVVATGTDDDGHPSDDPVIGHPDEFVWSVNSEVYHLAECRVVPQIAEQNRRSGHQPPAGKRLHQGCPQ